jgi:Sulfotransferase family
MRSPLEHVNGAGEPGPPDFVGVGAAGSGTRWWHSLLLAHPEIAPPQGRHRALHFFDGFCAREMTDADVAAYHERFPRRDGAISGEWTGRYMFDAWTPPLLRRAAPDAKLLVMLSDPIDRYRAVFAERLAKRSEGDRLYMADVVDRRSFGAQLARLHRFFDPERILVLQFERCRRDPDGEYRRTLEFLGVRDTAFAPRRLGPRAPAGLLGRLMPRRVGERLAGRPVAERAPAPLWPDLEAALHTALDPDVEALRELVPELDLALWPNFAQLTTPIAAAAR